MIDINLLPEKELLAVIVQYPDSKKEFAVFLYRHEINEFSKNSTAKVIRIRNSVNGKEVWPCLDS